MRHALHLVTSCCSVLAVFIAFLPACSSSDAASGGGGTFADAGPGSDTGSVKTDGGGDSLAIDGGDSGATEAGTAPRDGEPLVTDVAGSDECNAFCSALKAACPFANCDQSYECAVPTGSCAADAKAILRCKVDLAMFRCTGDGYTLPASCPSDPSICP